MGVGAAHIYSAHPRASGDPGVFVFGFCGHDMTAKFAKNAKGAIGYAAPEFEPLANLASLAVEKTWVPAFAWMSGLETTLGGIHK
jgi:hypothetical protein